MTHEAAEELRALLDRVEAGEAVTITRGGRPVARLAPVGAQPDGQGLVAQFIAFRKGNRLDGLDVKSLIEEGRR